MACSTMLLPFCASLFAAQLAVAIPVEPETEAYIADVLPEKFLNPDSDQIAIAKDRVERMTVSVSIADGGPYEFIIDTASFFNSYNAFFSNFLHCFCNYLSSSFIAIS